MFKFSFISMAKTFGWIFGVIFVVIGILGFFSNPIIGEGALFETDLTHNLIHLIIGLVLLFVASKGEGASSLWLKIFGVVYLLIAVVGFFSVDMSGAGSFFGVFSLNSADNWLHLIVGVLLLIGGFVSKKQEETPIPTQM